MPDIYDRRPMVQGFPELEAKGVEVFQEAQARRLAEEARLGKVLSYIERLVGSTRAGRIVVVGCGPHPETVRLLAARGMEVTGIEPVPGSAAAAKVFVGDAAEILCGEAEHIPAADGVFSLAFFESVLEHVDSPLLALQELHRVLAPGGLLLVTTTNRRLADVRGRNGEYNVPFFNWFPALVRESYVYRHLHWSPDLANYSPRPAVHWFTYEELCSVGRWAGFAQFYSLIDVARSDDAGLSQKPVRRKLLTMVQRNPWLRSLALTQVGGTIFMWKRSAP